MLAVASDRKFAVGGGTVLLNESQGYANGLAGSDWQLASVTPINDGSNEAKFQTTRRNLAVKNLLLEKK